MYPESTCHHWQNCAPISNEALLALLKILPPEKVASYNPTFSAQHYLQWCALVDPQTTMKSSLMIEKKARLLNIAKLSWIFVVHSFACTISILSDTGRSQSSNCSSDSVLRVIKQLGYVLYSTTHYILWFHCCASWQNASTVYNQSALYGEEQKSSSLCGNLWPDQALKLRSWQWRQLLLNPYQPQPGTPSPSTETAPPSNNGLLRGDGLDKFQPQEVP